MIEQQAEDCTRQATTGDDRQALADLTDTVRRYLLRSR
jgi:hypothetical protein